MTDKAVGTSEQEQSHCAGAELRVLIRTAVRQALFEMVQEEISELCGPRYQSGPTGEYRSAGSAPSSEYLNGHFNGAGHLEKATGYADARVGAISHRDRVRQQGHDSAAISTVPGTSEKLYPRRQAQYPISRASAQYPAPQVPIS